MTELERLLREAIGKREHRPPESSALPHKYDDEAICIHCGFDAAEWNYWKRFTNEGKAQPDARPPACTRQGFS